MDRPELPLHLLLGSRAECSLDTPGYLDAIVTPAREPLPTLRPYLPSLWGAYSLLMRNLGVEGLHTQSRLTSWSVVQTCRAPARLPLS